jgi:hypothetical protein
MKRLIVSLSAVFLPLCVTGCTTYFTPAVSNSALGPKEHPVALVYSEATNTHWFGLGPSGTETMRAAIDKVRKEKGGDTLMNVFVDRTEKCFPSCQFPLYDKLTTMIYGTLIKYEDPFIPAKGLPEIDLSPQRKK